MQTFKEITYQNYIELRFNPKNLHETVQQQALIKYKRNAMLLAQIFSFNTDKKQQYKTQSLITDDHISQIQRQINEQEMEGEKRIKQIEQKTKNYRQLIQKIKQIKTEEDKTNFISQIKEAGLYDNKHPYFVQQSPFFLQNIDQQHLQVTMPVQPLNEKDLVLFQIN